jgi:hypothetical protein
MLLLRGVPVEGAQVPEQPIGLDTAEVLDCPFCSERSVPHQPSIEVGMASLLDKLPTRRFQMATLYEEMKRCLPLATTAAIGVYCEFWAHPVKKCLQPH